MSSVIIRLISSIDCAIIRFLNIMKSDIFQEYE